LDAYAEDLLDTLASLRILDCIYVGHSVAGMVGVLASIQAPKFFRKLILLGSSACYLNKDGYHGGFDADDLRELLDAATFNYIDWSREFGQLVVSAPPSNPTVREFVQNLQSMRPDVVLSLLTTIFNSDLRSRLPEVTVPTIILQAAHDAAVSKEAAEYLRDHLRNSAMEVLDAAGHLPHLTAPDEVIRSLKRHL
jgi:sigma-B regulation protein RsbQ